MKALKIILIICILFFSAYFAIDINNTLNNRVKILNPYVHEKYNNNEIINYNIFKMTLKLANGKNVDYLTVKQQLEINENDKNRIIQ